MHFKRKLHLPTLVAPFYIFEVLTQISHLYMHSRLKILIYTAFHDETRFCIHLKYSIVAY